MFYLTSFFDCKWTTLHKLQITCHLSTSYFFRYSLEICMIWKKCTILDCWVTFSHLCSVTSWKKLSNPTEIHVEHKRCDCLKKSFVFVGRRTSKVSQLTAVFHINWRGTFKVWKHITQNTLSEMSTFMFHASNYIIFHSSAACLWY